MHSNPWTGFAVGVEYGQKRGDLEAIQDAINGNRIAPLADDIITCDTEIALLACGLGSNTAMALLVQQLIGGDDQVQPKVLASDHFVRYTIDDHGQTERSIMRAHYGYYKTGYYPGDIKLSRQFQSRYPDVSIYWRSAIDHQVIEEGVEAYSYRFNVPITWDVLVSSDEKMPLLITQEEKEDFLYAQYDLLAALAETGIDLKYFRWQYKVINSEDGEQRSIRIKGKSTIVCVLQKIAG